MSQRLELRYVRDDDHTGELFLTAVKDEFAGMASASFHDRDIEAFGRTLADTFPLPPGTEVRLQGGYWKSRSNPPELEETLLGITVYPVDNQGTIGVLVELKNERCSSERSRSCARMELRTNYEPLRTFGAQVVSLLHSNSAVAELRFGAA